MQDPGIESEEGSNVVSGIESDSAEETGVEIGGVQSRKKDATDETWPVRQKRTNLRLASKVELVPISESSDSDLSEPEQATGSLSPPRGKRTEQEDAVAPEEEEDAGQGGECSFAGPSGTSGGGASSDVVVVVDSEDNSGEEAAQVAQEDTVRKQTVVVAGRVVHTKTSKPSRSMQALLARQRRLDATVAEYRRLVELEGEDTQSSTSNGTPASSSAPPRSAGQRSAPAVRSRAGRRHRRAAKPAPHSTLKARLRRATHRVSDLEAEVRKLKEHQNLCSFDFSGDP
ncbi:uncharacterized protein LOC144764821 [Lissotriton helveticus]